MEYIKETILIHKKTKQRLLSKKKGVTVSSFYVLDENNKKIREGYNSKGDKRYSIAVCLNNNVY